MCRGTQQVAALRKMISQQAMGAGDDSDEDEEDSDDEDFESDEDAVRVTHPVVGCSLSCI